MASKLSRWGRLGGATIGLLALVVLVGARGSGPSLGSREAVASVDPTPAVTVTTAVQTTSTPVPTTTTTVPTTTTTTVPPLTVLQVTPTDNAKGVGFYAPLVVTYNRPPGTAVPLPTISPATPGRWARKGDQLVFKPTAHWEVGATYRISVPLGGGASPCQPSMVFRRAVYWELGASYRASVPIGGGTWPCQASVAKFSVALPSVLALQQYLAMLGYLPLRFTPTGEVPNRKAVLEREPTGPNLLSLVPVAGTFTWAYPGIPASLVAQWHRGQPNSVTTGAVMGFELDEGLPPDGYAGSAVWEALLKAVAERQMGPRPYDYLIVSEALPETLYVWQDGRFVYDTPTNTGVPGAATPQGTWPVVYKQNPNLMKGCEPDGYCYSVWVAYASYFLPSVGDAVHAYPRYRYGYPQSNGCVEVEPSQGAVVYGYDPVGTLVTVSSWVGPAQQS
ncbi:MAG TPA: L,D-transpeptidase family protein [Acidimicrobiales bacterium]|nr:L,D-transpeptidase family protein [Acidimicrobiales bacterium]